MKRPPSAKPYDVGYGKPPKHSQFQKGQSGNRSGRKKGAEKSTQVARRAPGLEDIIMAEAYRTITLRENDKPVEMPMIQAVMRSLGVSAVKGNFRAQLAVAGLVQSIEERSYKDQSELLKTIIEYKNDWEEEFARYDRAGKPRPDIVPHPDDLVVDTRKGRVIFNGPFDDKQRAEWDRFFELKADSLKEIEDSRKAMKRTRSARMKEIYADDIKHSQKLIDLVDRTFPDEKTRRKPDFNIHEWREKQEKSQARAAEWRRMREERDAKAVPQNEPTAPLAT